jgi:uncharacterized protein YbgA (DUF1722 family)
MTDDEFDDILDQADKLTNEQLKDKIAALTKLTAEDLQKIAPTVADKNVLLKLMGVVRSTANDNDKKAQILANIEMYAGIILNIAGKVLL